MMAHQPRTVITGVGALTADGDNIDTVWASFIRSTDGAVKGRIEGLDPTRWLTRKQVSRSARFVHLAIAAADEAVIMAGSPDFSPRRTGVVVATIYAALAELEEFRVNFDAAGLDAVPPYYGSMTTDSAAASAVALRYGIRGPTKTVMAACGSGGYAIADAVELVRSNRCDVVIAGGTQPFLTPTFQAWAQNLRVASPDGWCRPFDRRRTGYAHGEGAAALVIERLDHALERGAEPLAEVLGWGETNDASDLVRPSGRGAAECMSDALDDAGLDPHDITYINAHGTGTLANDATEAEAIREIFGDPGPAVTSIKRVSGHLLGAAGVLEAVAVVLSIRHGCIPQAANDFEVDPDLGLDVVSGEPRAWVPGPAITNSFGLGGNNCSLVIAPYDDTLRPTGGSAIEPKHQETHP